METGAPPGARRAQIRSKHLAGQAGLVLTMAILATSGCAVKKTTRVATPPAPALEASLDQLVEKVNAWNGAVRTLVATTDLEPTVGSVYSGVIKQYHDVKGIILMEKPALIRVVGQAPVVRTDIFDMASNGERFELFIPSKQQFIVGKTRVDRPAKNALENLRPQHILEALMVPRIDPQHEEYYSEEEEQGAERFYVLNVMERQTGGHAGALRLLRKVWFNRATLQISRVQFYGSAGEYLEDVQYSNYKDFAGVNYPASIEMVRPVEDIRLMITVLTAKFNQPIDAAKFVLNKPESATLVDLSQVGTGGPASPRREAGPPPHEGASLDQ